MKKHLFILLFAFVILKAQSQITKRTCGSLVPDQRWNDWFNNKVEEFKKNAASQKGLVTNYSIPVVFHIIHGGQSVGTFPNLSQAQINSQITILNNDFAGNGYNVGNFSSTSFPQSLIANCNITFCLAQKDPSGANLPEAGIDRINYVSKGWNDPASSTYNSSSSFQSYMNGTIKPASIWDPTRYMNIWVSDDNSSVGLLGYATFPSSTGLPGLTSALGTSTTDGVWCWAKAIGDVGTLSPPYDKGRTATHEIGHWLGLRHIGGDALCGDDYCTDTPTQKGGFAGGQTGQNYGCPSHPYTASGECSGTTAELFMNFMDYVDDGCMYMFTNDQRTRIQTAMANCPFRSQLTTSSATLCSGSSTACSYTISNFTNTDTLANPFGMRRATASAAETFCTQGPGKAGYIAGTNCYGDKEKAEFISSAKYSTAGNPIVTGVIVLFFNYTGIGTDGTGNVSLNIYSGTSAASAPGTLLGSSTDNLTNIANTANVTGVSYCGNPGLAFNVPIIMPYKFNFTTPVGVPTSGGFFASVVLPTGAGDTVAIFDKLTGTTNTAWEKFSDNSWHDMKTSWGGSRNFNLAILPVVECALAGVKENSVLHNNISLFPNPSNGNFNIVTTLPNSQNIEVTVYNMLGQRVYTNKVNNVKQNMIEIDLHNQAGGVYLVEINNGSEKVVKRMVINK